MLSVARWAPMGGSSAPIRSPALLPPRRTTSAPSVFTHRTRTARAQSCLGSASLPAQSTFRRYRKPAAFAAGRHPLPGFEYLAAGSRAPVCASLFSFAPSRARELRRARPTAHRHLWGACRWSTEMRLCRRMQPTFQRRAPVPCYRNRRARIAPARGGPCVSRHPDPLCLRAAPRVGVVFPRRGASRLL
jgi:hypothetical protein